jgi:GT2 family glycosyltransferase
MEPLVSICIVHYGDGEFLTQCVKSIKASTYKNIQLIVIDNNDTVSAENKFCTQILKDLNHRYIKNGGNLGYAQGCNQGVRNSRGKYVFILNNDIELEKNCIHHLVQFAEKNPEIGIIQPKMLDYHNRQIFHSSAAGGFIDVLGYPFARGRIFETVEKDVGQYNDIIEIFWAGGAALFAKKGVIEGAGFFDPDFFMYMEEIDLLWRTRLMGWKSVYIPRAKIYHIGCPHLNRQNPLRIYLEHRNSVLMLIKNLSFKNLICYLPLRLALEFGIMIASFFAFKFHRAFAILKSFAYLLKNYREITSKRQRIQINRKMDDRYALLNAYCGSVVLKYFLRGTTTASNLKGFKTYRYITKRKT